MTVKTVSQARALPEIADSFFDTQIVLDERGVATQTRTARPFVARPVDGDEIMWFRDADGRVMEVVYTESGPCKMPFRA